MNLEDVYGVTALWVKDNKFNTGSMINGTHIRLPEIERQCEQFWERRLGR